MLPFESAIDKALSNYGNPTGRLQIATQGELTLKQNNSTLPDLKLYAPQTWANGVSLNYFIPQTGCDVSHLLTHDFCRGMVYRSLNDNYADYIFRELLGWNPDYVVSSNTPSSSSSGSTALKMPYNGSISINGTQYRTVQSDTSSDRQINATTAKTPSTRSYEDNDSLYAYVSQFHPNYPSITYSHGWGTTVSILKKDGTWDAVASTGELSPTFLMSDLKFNGDSEVYARTVDGYLRAKFTIHTDYGGHISYANRFFVIDYKPQKIGLSYRYGYQIAQVSPEFPRNSNQDNMATTNEDNLDTSVIVGGNKETLVTLIFSNLEGIDRLVVEQKKEGAKVPTKIEVTDFKKGRYSTKIIATTTFTVVGYNDNGYSRSESVTLHPIKAKPGGTIIHSIENGNIVLNEDDTEEGDYQYAISPSCGNSGQTTITGTTTERIDISDLHPGFYSIKVINKLTGEQSSFSFHR